jgi:hypothetical protein
MSEINVLSRTQVINVSPGSGTVSVTNAGPMGPAGPPPAFTDDAVERVRALLEEASSRRVRVQTWGGSVTAGDPGASNPRTTSWAGLIKASLCSEYGDGGSGYEPAWLADTETGTWVLQDWAGFAASEFRASAAASLTWNALVGTRICIFYRNNITGSFRYRVDGGSWTTVSPPTGFQIGVGRVEITGLSNTGHSLNIEWLSGVVGINGVLAERATGIVFHRCAVGGRGFTNYDRQPVRRADIGITNASPTITCPAPGHFTSADIGRYLFTVPPGAAGVPSDAMVTAVVSSTSATISANATATGTRTVDYCVRRPSDEFWPGLTRGNAFEPGLVEDGSPQVDLVICGLGVNDGADPNGGLDRTSRGLDRVLGSSGEAAREVLILSEHQAAFGTTNFGIGVRALGQAMAKAMGGLYVDFWTEGRHSYAYATSQGWLFDPVHLADPGHVAVHDLLAEVLLP